MLFLLVLCAAATVALTGCANADQTKGPVATNTGTSARGKIPITTSSEEARKEFTQGRDLNEKLLIQDSIAHFDKAISLDPNFAAAELNRANVLHADVVSSLPARKIHGNPDCRGALI